jgi:hypothetical protein
MGFLDLASTPERVAELEHLGELGGLNLEVLDRPAPRSRSDGRSSRPKQVDLAADGRRSRAAAGMDSKRKRAALDSRTESRPLP